MMYGPLFFDACGELTGERVLTPLPTLTNNQHQVMDAMIEAINALPPARLAACVYIKCIALMGFRDRDSSKVYSIRI